jgi:hypothetical protein
MADLSITATNLIPQTSAVEIGRCGETLVAGDVIYLANGLWLKADADLDTAPAANQAVAIALGGGAVNQYISLYRIQQGNRLAMGTILTKGAIYVISAAAGKVAPIGDLTTGDFLYLLGYAESTSIMAFLGIRTAVTI